MDIVDGAELHYAWHDMSDGTKRWVVEQLKGYLGQLRALKPPTDGAVMSVTGGPMRDGNHLVHFRATMISTSFSAGEVPGYQRRCSKI